MADYTEQFVVEDDTACADVRITDAAAIKAEPASGKSTGAAASTEDAEAAEPLDAHKLAQRQKQIDFGKNTLGYQRYVQRLPKESRSFKHPATPDINAKISKRCFDGQVKAWRRLLHQYDQEAKEEEERAAAGGGAAAAPAAGPTARGTPGRADASRPEGAGGRGRGKKGSGGRPRGTYNARGRGAAGSGRHPAQARPAPAAAATAGAAGGMCVEASSPPSSPADSYSSQPLDRGPKKRGFNNAFQQQQQQQHGGGGGGDGCEAVVKQDPAAAEGGGTLQQPQQPHAGVVSDAGGEGYSCEPVSKRSTTSRSMDTSQAVAVNQASTAGTAGAAAPGAPTSFSGLGLAARMADACARPPVPPRQPSASGGVGVKASSGQQASVQGVCADEGLAAAAGEGEMEASPARPTRPVAENETNVLRLILGNDSCMSWADDEPDVQL